MSELKQWAINVTLNNGWQDHKFHDFLSKSNQVEFLNSQIPFFYAVQAFPRALAKLASLIETNEDRLLVIDNLYEEHGQGDVNKFHTSTFKEFLNSLGWDKLHIENPWVTEWISNILSKNLTASEYAAYLSGIEYAYAPISKTISDHILTLELISPQHHYGVHAELDWIHGDELLQVASNISNDYDIIKKSFILAQKEFLYLYNHLIIPTAHQMKEINKEPISFYYTREDSNPELLAVSKVLNSINKAPTVLMIGSGGETLIDMLCFKDSLNIDVIDMNKNQIDLCKSKILELLSGKVYSNSNEEFLGKFEQVFKLIRDFFGYNDDGDEDLLSTYIKNSDIGKSKLKYIVQYLFSNENLTHVFGERATIFSSESFSDHFYNVFIKSCELRDSHLVTTKNIQNIIDGLDIQPSKFMFESFNRYYQRHVLNYHISNFENLDVNKTYDIISISNIGDWMPLEEYRGLIKKLKTKLNYKGYIIARKLLGDYNLEDLLLEANLTPIKLEDRTYFYSEVYFGLNDIKEKQ